MNQSIKISEVKKGIIDKFSNFFDQEGYKLNKAQLRFTKKLNTSMVSFNFKTHSYFPSHCEYSFTSCIYLKELDEIIRAYNSFNNKFIDISCNLSIVEGEFIYEFLEKERKFKRFYTNEIQTEEGLAKALIQTFKIIENDVMPLINANTTLSNFQKNYLLPAKIIARIDEPEFIISCLLASSLIDIDFFIEIRNFIEEETGKFEKANNIKLTGLQNLLNSVSAFVESYHTDGSVTEVLL
jgi:hypothetical protein